VKIIVGLGNPGSKYKNTRHNAGFVFIEKLWDYLGWDKNYDVSDWKEERKLKAQISEVRNQNGSKILLVKPLTFMNLSGESVQKVVSMYKVNIEKELILAHDDLDLKLGNYKIQLGTSPKKHNGVNSVEQFLGNRNFLRVRIGVDSRESVGESPGEEYVLLRMKESELDILKNSISGAVKELRSILSI